MIYRENPNFVARTTQPNPREVSYWIDLTESPQGQIIKTWVSGRWVKINPSDASGGGLDLSEVQAAIANLTANKTDKSEVYTKEETVGLIAASIENVVDAAPGALDTLNELAAALNDDPNFATTITNTIAQKQDKLISGESIKTINGNSLLGEGNIVIQEGEGGDIDLSEYITTIEADNKYQPKGEYLTSIPPQYVTDTELEDYALKTDIPDTDQFITEEEANATYQPKGSYLTNVPAEYVTESELSQKGYATTEQIPDISTKQDTLVSGTNIKTINNQSILGQGNIEITTGTGGITDAPSDGTIYGRQNGNWVEVNVDMSDYLTIENAASTYQPKGNYLTQVPEEYITEGELIAKNYATVSQIPSLDNLATKTELNTKQDTLVSGTNIKTVNGVSILGSGNITIETPEGGISDAPQDGKTYGRKNAQWSEITIPDTSALATKTEIADMATQTWVGEQGYLTEHQDISNLATKEELASKANTSDLSNYLTTANASTTYETISGAQSKYQPVGEYALKSEIPSLSGYATESYVNTQVSNLVNSAPEALNTLDELAAALNDDSNFATTVTNQIAAKLDITTYTSDKETFALKTELSGKADSSALANYLTTATAESTYAKKSEIPQQSLLPYDFFGTIDNYSTDSSITIDTDSKYLSVYNAQANKSLLHINFTNGLYKGVEYLVIVISNNYTLNVQPQGYGGQNVQIIGDTESFSMQANQILEISAIRTDSTVICRVSSSSGYIDSVYDGIFG